MSIRNNAMGLLFFTLCNSIRYDRNVSEEVADLAAVGNQSRINFFNAVYELVDPLLIQRLIIIFYSPKIFLDRNEGFCYPFNFLFEATE